MSTLASELNIVITADAGPASDRAGVTAPLHWIQKGIEEDFRSTPLLSLLYGALFAGLCVSLYFATRNAPWFTLAYLNGLVIVGAFAAAGLYAASRDIERGERPSIAGTLRVVTRRKTYLAQL